MDQIRNQQRSVFDVTNEFDQQIPENSQINSASTPHNQTPQFPENQNQDSEVQVQNGATGGATINAGNIENQDTKDEVLSTVNSNVKGSSASSVLARKLSLKVQMLEKRMELESKKHQKEIEAYKFEVEKQKREAEYFKQLNEEQSECSSKREIINPEQRNIQTKNWVANVQTNKNQETALKNEEEDFFNIIDSLKLNQDSILEDKNEKSALRKTKEAKKESFFTRKRTLERFPLQESPIIPHKNCQEGAAQTENDKFKSNEKLKANEKKETPKKNVDDSSDDRISTDNFLARQTCTKLPKFNGDPIDWPMFYSSFLHSTRVCAFTNGENLGRLNEYLEGKAKNAVRALLIHESNVPRILETLKLRFGNPSIVIWSLIEKIRQIPRPSPGDFESLVEFSVEVQNLTTTVMSLGAVEHNYNPTLLLELRSKLPYTLQLRWGEFSFDRSPQTLGLFSEWLFRIAQGASSLGFIKRNSNTKDSKGHKQFNPIHTHLLSEDQPDDDNSSTSFNNLHTHTTGNFQNSQSNVNGGNNHKNKNNNDFKKPEDKAKCFFCEGSSHQVVECKKFSEISRSDRWAFIKKHKICFICLVSKHAKASCPGQKKCGVDECKKLHHPILHNPKSKTEFSGHHQQDQTSVMLFRVLPVKLKHKEKEVKTFAFLDEGSAISLMDDSICEDLGLSGIEKPLFLQWTSGTTREEKGSKQVSLKISGDFPKAKDYWLNGVRTVKDLALPTQTCSAAALKQKYKYLEGLPIPQYENAQPKILIGLDNKMLGLSKKIVEGPWNGPVAALTRLGWVLFGDNQSKDSSTFYNCHVSEVEQLEDLVNKFFTTEEFGVRIPKEEIESNENKRANKILEETTRKVAANRYETGLLWKYDEVKFPDNRRMALNRLRIIERKMSGDKEYARLYKAKIDEYVRKGYARKLEPHEAQQRDDRTWYLPHFGVINPNKPGKFRLVFDARATMNGISYNSQLLAGSTDSPKVQSNFYVFREGKIAFTGDIEEMFPRVLIRKEDQNAQRFLWGDGDSSKEPDEYVNQAMIFGSKSSPRSAKYVKDKNAESYKSLYPEAYVAITENHFVDDWTDSCDTEKEAIILILQVKEIHQAGGFNMRNWTSNSETVLLAIESDAKVSTLKNLENDTENETSSILGMWWDTTNDCFLFKLSFHKIDPNILSLKKKPTKRQFLKVLMSVFDPLGLLTNFVVYGKIILQQIWIAKIEWDDEIPDDIYERFKLWISCFDEIKNLKIPRCYSPKIPEAFDIQLHVFCDASEEAFGCVAYFRIENLDGVDVVLVAAKSRVAPRKQLSIPRLELQAAVLGSRLSDTILKEHRISIDSCVFWTDSKTVISWLRSDQRRYKPFVAHRISEIQELTKIEAWSWIPTAENVADEATKWKTKPTFETTNRWFRAPEFLRKPPAMWPKEVVPEFTEEELRPRFVGVTRSSRKSFSFPNISRFSQWKRLVRSMAYVFRAISVFVARRKKITSPSGPLLPMEISKAFNYLIQKAQQESYPDEIACLKNNKPIERTSKILSLSPYLDENNIMRLRGRIDLTQALPESQRRPIILNRKHYITMLILDNAHRDLQHRGIATLIHNVRQTFWIPEMKAAAKSTKYNCYYCRRKAVRPNPPEMSALPVERLTPFVRPFTYIGMDYFGPYEVTIGRRHEKRWGVLFTCMTIRAIHLELANDLTTDSTILCLRNFMARRGTPAKILSDNQTNMKKASKDLRDEVSAIDYDLLQNKFAIREIIWEFSPPAGPHFGGTYERLIGEVKRILEVILKTKYPKEQVLRTFLCEIENIVNSRPLTDVPVEADEPEALTPNHFLIGTSSSLEQIGKFGENDRCLRNNWRISQQLANQFWKQWISAYLPTLTRRTKWFTKAKPLEIDDIVIIVDPDSPRGSWPIGYIVKVYPSSDGQVRSAEVKTAKGIYHRPATKLAVLDIEMK